MYVNIIMQEENLCIPILIVKVLSNCSNIYTNRILTPEWVIRDIAYRNDAIGCKLVEFAACIQTFSNVKHKILLLYTASVPLGFNEESLTVFAEMFLEGVEDLQKDITVRMP